MRTKGDHHIFYREGIEEIVNLQPLKDDELVKSQKTQFFVIPACLCVARRQAKAGIQSIQLVSEKPDSGACPGPRSGVHRSDDFLRNRQRW